MRIDPDICLKVGETFETRNISKKDWVTKSKPNARLNYTKAIDKNGEEYFYYVDQNHRKWRFVEKQVQNYSGAAAFFRSILGIVLSLPPFTVLWCCADEFMCGLFSRRIAKRYVFTEIPAVDPQSARKTAEKVNNVANSEFDPKGETTEPIALAHPLADLVDVNNSSPTEFNVKYDQLMNALLKNNMKFDELTRKLENVRTITRDDAINIIEEFEKIRCKKTREDFEIIFSNRGEEDQKIINQLIDGYFLLNERIGERVAPVVAALNAVESKAPPRIPGTTTGISNMGNTCYLNSALQVLFACSEFVNQLPNRPEDLPRIAGESEPKYKARCELYKVFLEIRDEWVKAGRDSSSIGAKVKKYRDEFYDRKAILGYFDANGSKERYYSVGDFFTHFFTMIGQDIKIKTQTDNLTVGNLHQVTSITHPFHWFNLKSRGNIQERANAHGTPFEEVTTKEDPRNINGHEIQSFKETIKIVGNAPQFLIVYVDTDRVKKYNVNAETDGEVDFSNIFETPPANGRYRLVGFSQNHSNVHWTAVVRTPENKWNHCDDSRTSEVTTSSGDFRFAASYLVYQKI